MHNPFADRRAHAPVNPWTGVPGDPARPGYWDSDEAATPDAAAPAADGDAVPAGARSDAPGGTADDADASASDRASGADAAEMGCPAKEGASPTEQLIARVLRVLDSRVVATAMLFAVLLLVIGIDHLLPFVALLFVGYVLIDRFIEVRRCVALGGAAWILIIFLGYLLSEYARGPLVFNISYLFAFIGLLFAFAVCAAFLVGRAMYQTGYDRAREVADHEIARCLEERLIEHPDSWDDLDGSYLEVEAALNRVRSREAAASQALRDEARRKDDLVTYLAHDLKTPLASVVGYLSLLEEAPDLPVEQRSRFCGIALEKARRLDALIEEFFDITRFDFHDMVLTRGYVDLNLLLAQVMDGFYPILADEGKTVDLAVPEGTVVLVDGDKMARVFNNVMRNAVAYSYEGSTIRIAAEREGDDVVIRFENHGDPIPEAKLKVIFEKFYRLDAARATNRGGAGLGLAIAREIVGAHGGSISCSSSPERTVFTIVLPMGAPERLTVS